MTDKFANTDRSFAYSSHLEATTTCAIRTGQIWPNSPMLELGCGHFSTPVLASISRAQGRHLTIISSDDQWAYQFKYLICRRIRIEVIAENDWPTTILPAQLGFALVDNEQLVRQRVHQVLRLANSAKVVLLHDANVILRKREHWRPIVEQFKHVYVFRRRYPYTAVLSNYEDPEPWFSVPGAS